MRRTVAIVCIALGVFLVVLAPLTRTLVAGSLMKTPMDYYVQTVNRGEDVTYFSIEDVELVEGATVEAHSTLRADVAASDADTVVWDQFTWIKDADTDFAILSSNRRAGHDRLTGEAVDCCDAMVNDESVTQSGQVWKFPFLTEKRDYDFFETTLGETRPMVYEGTETIKGVETYKFVQTVEPTKVGERVLPRSVAGLDGDGDVTADEMFSLVRTYWIEPVTGSPINVSEDQRRVAVADGEEVLVLFEGDLRFTEATIDWYIDNSEQGRTMLPILRTTLPIAAGVVGTGLILLGVLLLLAARARERY